MRLSAFVADGGHNVFFDSKTLSYRNGEALPLDRNGMDENYNWFVVYTKSNAEQRVMQELNEFFNKLKLDCFFEPFCPESEYYYKTGNDKILGKVYKKRPLFPCYVFIETDMPETEFTKTFAWHFRESSYVIRLLKYGNDNYALDKSEQTRFEYLFKGRRCLEHSEGHMEGDNITVTAGPLMGLEGYITHISRRNRTAKIKIELYGRVLEAKLALEVVSKK